MAIVYGPLDLSNGPFSVQRLMSRLVEGFQEGLWGGGGGSVVLQTPSVWSIGPDKLDLNVTVDLLFEVSEPNNDMVFRIFLNNGSFQEFKVSDGSLVRESITHWRLVGFNSDSVNFVHAITVELSGQITVVNVPLESRLSLWKDLRLGGTVLTRLESRQNRLFSPATQTEANAGVIRTAEGMYNNSGDSLWQHWLKFWDCESLASAPEVISWVIFRNSGTGMVGVYGDPHDELSTTQYYAAQVNAYCSGTNLSNLYGGEGSAFGGSNWNDSVGSNTIPYNQYIRLDFTNGGLSGGQIIAWQVGPNPADWDNINAGNKIFEANITTPASRAIRMPGCVIQSGTGFKLTAVRSE